MQNARAWSLTPISHGKLTTLTNRHRKPNNTFRCGVDLSENPSKRMNKQPNEQVAHSQRCEWDIEQEAQREREWVSSNYRFRIIAKQMALRVDQFEYKFWNQSVRIWAGCFGGGCECRSGRTRKQTTHVQMDDNWYIRYMIFDSVQRIKFSLICKIRTVLSRSMLI